MKKKKDMERGIKESTPGGSQAGGSLGQEKRDIKKGKEKGSFSKEGKFFKERNWGDVSGFL